MRDGRGARKEWNCLDMRLGMGGKASGDEGGEGEGEGGGKTDGKEEAGER